MVCSGRSCGLPVTSETIWVHKPPFVPPPTATSLFPPPPASRTGIEQRRSLPGEVRQHDEGFRPRWHVGRFLCKLLVGQIAGDLLEPAGKRSRRRHPGGKIVGVRQYPRSAPESGVGERLL